MSAEDAEDIESALRQVLEAGAPVILSEQWLRLREDPTRQWGLSLSAFRLEDPRGRPTGVAVVFMDTTEQLRARRRLNLAQEAAARFGSSLDVRRTAKDLADLLVPALGDLAGVELAQAVFDGADPPRGLGGDLHLRHAAVAPASGGPVAGIDPGDPIPPVPDSPLLRNLQQGRTVVVGRDELIARLGDPQLAERLLPKSFHSVMLAPLWARGFLLGDVTVWHIDRPDPFTREDADLLTEIASRAALAIDNARRYTREHRAAVALQQRLLPPDRHRGRRDRRRLPSGGRRCGDRRRLVRRAVPALPCPGTGRGSGAERPPVRRRGGAAGGRWTRRLPEAIGPGEVGGHRADGLRWPSSQPRLPRSTSRFNFPRMPSTCFGSTPVSNAVHTDRPQPRPPCRPHHLDDLLVQLRQHHIIRWLTEVVPGVFVWAGAAGASGSVSG